MMQGLGTTGWCAGAGCLALCIASSAWGAGDISGLGVLSGGTFSRGAALSADGSVVTGTSGSAAGERAFVWTAADGMQSLGVLAGGAFSRGAGITSDGTVIVGTSGSGSGDTAFRWIAGSGMASMGTLAGGTRSAALGICPDGAFSVGSSTNSGAGNDRAAMYAGVWFELGSLPGDSVSVGTSINQSASAVGGWSGTSPRRAIRWVSGIGVQDLGVLTGGADSFGNGISLDGNTVVGGSTVGGVVRAFRWTPAGHIESLGELEPGGESEAFGTSGTGDAAVGTASVGGVGGVGGVQHAIAWTRHLGMVDLNVYLASEAGGSVNLTGWVLTEARAISTDGTAIVGTGVVGGQTRAFVVRGIPPLNPPCRADFDGSGVLSINDIFSFIGKWFSGDASADFNHANGITIQDIFDFLAAWFAGCS